MMYRRRSYFRTPRGTYYRSVKPVKYSNETYNASFAYQWTSAANTTKSITMVPAVQTLGVRKVKNFTLSITQSPTYDSSGTTAKSSNFIYAIVYCPEGMEPQQLNLGSLTAASSLYEPNQNVIASGVCSSDSGQLRLSNRMSRNLNSGDRIYLLFRPTTSTGTANDFTNISAVLNYAIAY